MSRRTGQILLRNSANKACLQCQHTTGPDCHNNTQQRLQSCVEEIDRFQSLVKDVETLHEADATSEKLWSKVDLRQVVRSVVDLFHPRCKSVSLELSLKEHLHPVWVCANPTHLSQITWNLLDNAVKYTPSGGSITVSVESDERISILRVSDTGMGIPDHEIENVFERFYRVDKSRNRKTGGSGLGLAIVKRLIHISKGKIGIKSKEKEGTMVYVEWQSDDNP